MVLFGDSDRSISIAQNLATAIERKSETVSMPSDMSELDMIDFSLSNNFFLSLCPAELLVDCQDDQDGPYRGKFIGKFNSYHHQVGGDVYAVDASTFLIVNFNYDGNGIDTFFWSGASNRPGPQGFIVPDEFGK